MYGRVNIAAGNAAQDDEETKNRKYTSVHNDTAVASPVMAIYRVVFRVLNHSIIRLRLLSLSTSLMIITKPKI